MLLTSISTEGRISSQNRTWLCHLTAGLRPARPPTLGLGRYNFPIRFPTGRQSPANLHSLGQVLW